MGGGKAVQHTARRTAGCVVAVVAILAVLWGTTPEVVAAADAPSAAAMQSSALTAQASAAIEASNTANPLALGIARTVTAALHGSSQPMPPFTDLGGVPWAAPAIAVLAQEGILEGTAPHTFDPDGAISEAQVVTVLWRLLGTPKGPTTGHLPEGTPNWARAPLLWAMRAKLLVGIPLPPNPTTELTREQALALLLNGIGLGSLANSTRAMDSPLRLVGNPAAWAHGYLALAVDLGLIRGNEGKLDARQALSRAELAVILARTCGVEAASGIAMTHAPQDSGLGSGSTILPLAR